MNLYSKQTEYDHAIKFRPKGYSVAVWAYCVSVAVQDKAFAYDVIYNRPDWIKSASYISVKGVCGDIAETVINMAKTNYDYLKHRAFGESFIGALDPSARRRWQAITGKRVPPSQYWLYDHRDQVGANRLKFNVKRGYGWIKKTKQDLKKEA